jgi:hypothetical protein
MNNKLISLLIQALLLPAPCAEAQQPVKIPRIRLLWASSGRRLRLEETYE